MNSTDIEILRNWFLEEQRDLPWRKHRTPYAVWVSEIMLQQTQVSVVIPYFERWMRAFPTLNDLAAADPEQVVKLWEGLGYYSRARNLHKGAQHVVLNHNGIVPSDPKELTKIKGLGPYTVGAICAFAFQQKSAAVDGNVIRVVARLFAIEGDISRPLTVSQIRDRALSMLPDHKPWEVTEALIEFGATICSKVPKCQECPLRAKCQAFAQGKQTQLPVRKPRAQTTPLYRAVAVVQSKDSFLVRRVSAGEVMAGLYEFPYLETDSVGLTPASLGVEMAERLQLELMIRALLPRTTHSFTRFRAQLQPVLFTTEQQIAVAGYEWHDPQSISNLSFSSGHRRILNQLQGIKH